MKGNMKRLMLILCVCGLCGCVKYKHTRTAVDGSTEETLVRGFAGNAAIKNFSFQTRDGDYERTMGLEEGLGESDTQNQVLAIKAVAEGVAAGLNPAP